jgi:RNA polymerase sigma factor (sigma-70 family)
VNNATNVFAEYGDFIRTVIRYKVKNEIQVDDMFQDFYLSLVARPVPPSIQNIKSYLYRAITNDIIDATRRVEQYQKHTLRCVKRTNRFINKKTPEKSFIDSEEKSQIFELIEMRLPGSEAQAIRLRYKNNDNIKEIAKKMDVGSDSVRRYISVGLGKIRQLLTKSKAGH